MYLVFGLVSTAIIIMLEFMFLQVSFSLHDFRPWLVFPAGGLMDGALCAIGVYLYLKIKHIHLKPKYYFAGIFCAFIGFWAIYYMNYITAYVDGDIINHSFKGYHISTFMFNNQPFNFGTYLSYMFENYIVTTYSRSGMVLAHDNLGVGFHQFTFIIECIGFCLGGFLCAFVAIRGREYCKRCKLDFMRKKLYSFIPEALEIEIKGLRSSFESKEAFKNYVKNKDDISDKDSYIEASLKYCINCKTAFIEFRYMASKVKPDNEVVLIENEDRYTEISVPYDICLNI